MTTSTITTDTAASEIHERNTAALARIIQAGLNAEGTRARGIDDAHMAEIAQLIMMELAQVWREEAEHFAEAKRRGWKSTADQLTQAAARLAGFAQGLTNVVSTGTLTITADEIATCSHPDAQRSTLKSGAVLCTLCNEAVDQAPAEQLADLVPGTKRGPVVTGDATLDYLSGAVDTYEPAGHNSPVGTQVTVGGIGFTKIGESPFGDGSEAAAVVNELIAASPVTPAADNPFTSPATPGSNRAPVKRLTWAELGPLTAVTYPVPRPHLSHSYVESLSKCGLSALLSDASKAGHLGPRRPSWSLIGGSAFHAAIETIERAALGIGGADPSLDHDSTYWAQFWEAALTYQVDELTQSLTGTPYASPATWHTANKGLEGYDWWRVQGLDMLMRYLKLHDTPWRKHHTLLQVPADPTAESVNPGNTPRVPVLELPFTVAAGSTSLTTTGFIDAAWLCTSPEYPTATLEVVDYKSGKSLPADHLQLVEYADALRKHLPVNFGLPVVGRFYRARLGAYTPPIPLPQRAGQDEIDYRYQTADRAMKHAAFAPHVDNMCSSCGSVDFCPAQALRDGAAA